MYSVYQVTSNDTIRNLAENLGFSLNELIELNGNIDQLTPGQLLVVPNLNSPYFTYNVKKGDNLYQIAKEYDTKVDVIEKLNGLEEGSYIYPNQKLLIPKTTKGLYITKENQTIANLVNELGIDINQLLDKNIYLMPDQIITYKKKDIK